MRSLDDFAYDCVAWWHPRHGHLTIQTIATKAQHNGYPEATITDVREALDRLSGIGAIKKGWY